MRYVRTLRATTLSLRRVVLRMVDKVEATVTATITFSHLRSTSTIFPVTLVQDLAVVAVDISIQMDAGNTVINFLVGILPTMTLTMDMEDMTVEMVDQADLADLADQMDLVDLAILTDQVDQGGQGGPIAIERVPGADANEDADFVFLMTAYLATVGIMEHLLFQMVALVYRKVIQQMR